MVFKVDFHTHILPSEMPNWKEKFGYGGFVSLEHHKSCCAKMLIDGKLFREIEDNCYNPESRIRDLERTHVHVQVLSTVPVMFNYGIKGEHCLEIAKFLNDHIAEIVKKYPKRFIGLGTLPMQDPDLAVKELRRCMQDLGLKGVQIGSHVNSWNLNAPELFPIFEEAERLNAAIFVHPWDMMGKGEMDKYWLPWLVGMPAETCRAICSLIFGGVMERLPNLKFIFAHGGGSFPSTIGRIEHGFMVRPDLCQVDNDVNPRNYLSRFWVDSLVHDPIMLQFIVSLIGRDKIVLGSDYPFPLGEDIPGQLVESMDTFDRETKAKILGENALELLGLKKEQFL
jgi:aminocarboxymuconate-semialdehyde decarboxylase